MGSRKASWKRSPLRLTLRRGYDFDGKRWGEFQIQGTELVKRLISDRDCGNELKLRNGTRDLYRRSEIWFCLSDTEVHPCFRFQGQCKGWYAGVETLTRTYGAQV